MEKYLVATIKPWNIEAYHRRKLDLPGEWHLVESKEKLADAVARLQPRYIFFPHWSWTVENKILEAAECVCFHMTDVPFGRGGSPLQNLIARGHKDTKLTALRMAEELDTGPVYMKRDLSLSGSAGDIFERMADKIYGMIEELVRGNLEPVPQTGEPTFFARRTSDKSALPSQGGLKALYDHIRMLDADTYPRAFIDHGDFRLEFSKAEIGNDGTLSARVQVAMQTRK
ncbi:MAG TPA: hypothetical protein QF509_00580 [Rhodospirillales bacterium]|jgi:methionyl-tRNA formyltransferase|nr:hypothetical protein [Rhodospirillales bacterium]|tara:strand:- start:99 stop:782 length:684 start_codon:yes stop_codon:yes gene_type:complete